MSVNILYAFDVTYNIILTIYVIIIKDHNKLRFGKHTQQNKIMNTDRGSEGCLKE